MKLDFSLQEFFSFLQAGLWETEVRLLSHGEIALPRVFELASEQSVVGLVTSGLEQVKDVQVPKDEVLPFLGNVLQMERRNRKMNAFIAALIGKLRSAGVEAVLVKGQGIAQCYERPLWRAAGDVDLFLDGEQYQWARTFLVPLAQKVEEEQPFHKHLALFMGPWEVELHGTLRAGLWRKLDRVDDMVQRAVFDDGKVRSWMDEDMEVRLPGVDEDVFLVFSHILQHFFKGGIGLRQICDWCRLLWTFRGCVDVALLESRLRAAGVMSEWHAFAALAVEYLGMPVEAMPLYAPDKKWKQKASRVLGFVLETGNFGQRRDKRYLRDASYMKRKAISFRQNTSDSIKHAMIFPLGSCKVWWTRLFEGIAAVRRGK